MGIDVSFVVVDEEGIKNKPGNIILMNAVSKHQVIPRFYSWQKSINLWTGSEAQGVDHASLPENNSENLMKSYPHIHSNPQKKEEKEKRSKKEKEERKMMTTSFSTPTAYFQYMREQDYDSCTRI